MIFKDMHADTHGKVTRDLQQDCEAFYLDSSARSIFFERYFDTCDDDDYVIEVRFNLVVAIDIATKVLWVL